MLHFALHGLFDVSPFTYDDATFDAETWRQTAPGTPHQDTQSIYWRMPSVITRESVFEDLSCIDRPSFAPYRASVEHICAMFDLGSIARVMIVKLRAGGSLVPHRDEGTYAEQTRRYHIPLETNPLAYMISGGEIVHMMVGEVWWFDKSALHYAINDGIGDRVHLIVDTY